MHAAGRADQDEPKVCAYEGSVEAFSGEKGVRLEAYGEGKEGEEGTKIT